MTWSGTPTELSREILSLCRGHGFVAAGITSVDPLDRGGEALRAWLERGFHGTMDYLDGPDRAAPVSLLGGAKSVVSVALPYGAGDRAAGGLAGRVARYARGDDYHGAVKARLRSLATEVAERLGRPVASRACVDTAPLLEHEVAARAGVGFVGKHTLTIVPGAGSYVVLGELLLDVALEAGEATEPRCGDCVACLTACPTGAFVSPYVLDARRCISYLTIEYRGWIPRELRALMGAHVFGCDVCQEVCPFNTHAAAGDPALVSRPELAGVDLEALLLAGSSDHKRRVRGTPLARASRNQLARNAAVALGNCGDPGVVGALTEALRNHPSALVRGHAAWGLGRHLDGPGGDQARRALDAARDREQVPEVRAEILAWGQDYPLDT